MVKFSAIRKLAASLILVAIAVKHSVNSDRRQDVAAFGFVPPLSDPFNLLFDSLSGILAAVCDIQYFRSFRTLLSSVEASMNRCLSNGLVFEFVAKLCVSC